jgi:hypothetical protein
MSETDDSEPAPSRGGSSIWTRLALVVFLLPVVVVLFPTTVVLLPMMLPTIVAFTIDRAEGRPFTITVGLLNGAGTLPAVLGVWAEGHNLAVAQGALSEVLFWFIAYLCAAIGWTIYMVLPPILRQYYGSITDSRVDALRKEQDKLIEEWGEDVTGAAAVSDQAARGKGQGRKQDAQSRMDAAATDLSD